MNREQILGELADRKFDLIVIGAGISGSLLAYDAARRGLDVALVERSDFGAETSSASSKVLHGGIRFLRQLRIDKVRESAIERLRMRALVPHLCRDVPFVIPAMGGFGSDRKTLTAAGMLYRLASLGAGASETKALAPRLISQAELETLTDWVRHLEGTRGALVVPEIHMASSERVTWCFVDGARRAGATVANYVEGVDLIGSHRRVEGVRVSDRVSGRQIELRGRVVANCAGPWIDAFNDAIDTKGGGKAGITAFCRGAHIVADLGGHSSAIALPTRQKIEGISGAAGRSMFLIPWRGKTLVGTSYSRHEGSLDEVGPTDGDVGQLVEGINGALGFELLNDSNILHAYAGIYPLTTIDVDTSRYQGAADYKIVDHKAADDIDGYLSVFGAKYTTARRLAEVACNKVVKKLGESFRPCDTAETPTPAASDSTSGESPDLLGKTAAFLGIKRSELDELVASDPTLDQPLDRELELAAVAALWSARNESVVHLGDFVFRRTGLGTLGHPGEHAIRESARILGAELNWNDSRIRAEIRDVESRYSAIGLQDRLEAAG